MTTVFTLETFIDFLAQDSKHNNRKETVNISTNQNPKETIYRLKDNGSYHISNLKDGVLDPIETEKLYFEDLVSDTNFQILYDSCPNQNIRSTNHTSDKLSPI